MAMGDADLDLYEDVDDFNIKVKYIASHCVSSLNVLMLLGMFGNALCCTLSIPSRLFLLHSFLARFGELWLSILNMVGW